MRLSFRFFSFTMEATNLDTNEHYLVRITGNQDGLTTTTTPVEDLSTVGAAGVGAGTDNNTTIDSGEEAESGANGNNNLIVGDDGGSSTGSELSDHGFGNNDDRDNTDDEVEFIGTRLNQSVNLLDEADTSSEYEASAGFSQEVFVAPKKYNTRSNKKN